MKRIALSRLPTEKQDYQEDIVFICSYTISKPLTKEICQLISYTTTQKKNRIRNLLQEMTKEKAIMNQGGKGGAKWVLQN